LPFRISKYTYEKLKEFDKNINIAVLYVAEKENCTVDDRDVCNLAKIILYIKKLKFIFH
jgi:hypothetical protein